MNFNPELRRLNLEVELQSEKFYKLFYHMPIMVFMVDNNNVILNKNEKANMFFSNENKIFTSYIHKSKDVKLYVNMINNLKDNNNCHLKNISIKADENKMFKCDIHAFYCLSNNIKIIFVLLVDNSEIYILNEKIYKSEKFYSDFFDNMFNALLLVEVNGSNITLLKANREFEKLTNLKNENILINNILDKEWEDNIQTCVKEQKFITLDLYSKNFSNFFFINIYPVNSIQCMCIFQISNKQTMFENQLKTAMSILDTIMEGLIVTDSNANIIHVNTAFTKITGYEKDEVFGKNPKFLQSGIHDQDFYSNMWNDLFLKGQWQGELWNRRKNDDHYPEWATISVIKNERNEVTNYVKVFSDISSLKNTEKKIFNLAFIDPLTNLPNRLMFNSHVDILIKKNQKFAVLFMDLDGFKNINDTLGHDVGDQVLLATSDKLKEILRDDDFISRFGGDEFVIVIENSENVDSVSRKIINEFESYKLNNLNVILTFSIGVSYFPKDGNNIINILKNADIAMYEAKRNGKNNFQTYNQLMANAVNLRARTDLQIRQAIKNNEFFLHYQPQLDLKTNKIDSLEALVRWRTKEFGILYPNSFIEISEETNLIVDIGEFVYKQVFSDLKNCKIAINFSIRQLEQENFVEKFLENMRFKNIQSHLIEAEVTESILMRKSPNMLKNIEMLKDNNIGLVIDDFGVGYSSFGYLQNLPIYKIKIDRSFLVDVPNNLNNNSIIKAIISLCKNLNLKVVAEGVETKEQLEFLIENDCDYVQGFYISKPKKILKFTDDGELIDGCVI